MFDNLISLPFELVGPCNSGKGFVFFVVVFSNVEFTNSLFTLEQNILRNVCKFAHTMRIKGEKYIKAVKRRNH